MAAESKSLPPWGSAVAGATGAVLANAAVYPLDMFDLSPAPRLLSLDGVTKTCENQRQNEIASSRETNSKRY
jgi:hypothetical protein